MLSLILLLAQVQSADAYDVVITNARLIDGTGRPARAAEIGVRGGWIAKIGAPGSLRTAVTRDRIDAKGMVVAPGFIDVHSHTDEAIGDSGRRYNEGAVRQGVTTVVGGPDGGAGPSDMRTLDRGDRPPGRGDQPRHVCRPQRGPRRGDEGRPARPDRR